jgi:hypothetical protein
VRERREEGIPIFIQENPLLRRRKEGEEGWMKRKKRRIREGGGRKEEGGGRSYPSSVTTRENSRPAAIHVIGNLFGISKKVGAYWSGTWPNPS